MAAALDDFGTWVEHVFDHEVTDPSWWWDLPDDAVEPSPRLPLAEPSRPVAIAHLSRLFSTPRPALDRFTNAQVAQGLWFLFMGVCSNDVYVDGIADPGLPQAARLSCLNAIPGFYRGFLARLCPDGPAAVAHEDPLGEAMYMLWDLTELAPKGSERKLDDTLFAMMASILTIPHAGCRESALHGLGHWHELAAGRVEATIDVFLDATPDLSEALRAYATSAREGNVQ